jgi:hypothetical protein
LIILLTIYYFRTTKFPLYHSCYIRITWICGYHKIVINGRSNVSYFLYISSDCIYIGSERIWCRRIVCSAKAYCPPILSLTKPIKWYIMIRICLQCTRRTYHTCLPRTTIARTVAIYIILVVRTTFASKFNVIRRTATTRSTRRWNSKAV